MKVTRNITTELELNLEITEATLLTADEAEKLPERLRKHVDGWWLQSCGCHSDHAACVYPDGRVFRDGDYVCLYYSVRPALVISSLESSGLKIGDIFNFGYKQFEIISNNKAFCLTNIGTYVFKIDFNVLNANDYEKSDVKTYVDEWFWYYTNIEEVDNKENKIKEVDNNEPLYKCKDCRSELRCPCDPNSDACGFFYPTNRFLIKTEESLLEKFLSEENKPLSPQERDVLLHLIEKDLNKRKY